MADRTQRFLDAVHDYMPRRAQAWIEDRAFIRNLEETYAADLASDRVRSSVQQHYAGLERAQFGPSPGMVYAVDRLDEQTAFLEREIIDAIEVLKHRSEYDHAETRSDHGQEVSALLNGRDVSAEEMRAAASWLKDAGESYMAEIANGRGQPDLFSDFVETYRHAANDAVPIHKPTETVAYRVEHAFHDKHHPGVSQEQRDAHRAAAATPESAGQISMRLEDMQKSNDHGLER